jgi:hypothetical protein
MFSSSMHAQLDRPAAAGMVVPVMVLGAEHLDQAYRPAVGAVNFAGTDAFESALRLSFTP